MTRRTGVPALLVAGMLTPVCFAEDRPAVRKNPIGMTLVAAPAGSFTVGDDNAHPVRRHG